MEVKRWELMPHVDLTYLPARKFKTGVLSAQFITPLAKETASYNALLPAVLHRGKNASKASVAKHASPEEYRASTGMEALFGWLCLQGQEARIQELFEVIWQQFDPNAHK